MNDVRHYIVVIAFGIGVVLTLVWVTFIGWSLGRVIINLLF
jgi:uncharacterized protein (DUF697 family)